MVNNFNKIIRFSDIATTCSTDAEKMEYKKLVNSRIQNTSKSKKNQMSNILNNKSHMYRRARNPGFHARYLDKITPPTMRIQSAQINKNNVSNDISYNIIFSVVKDFPTCKGRYGSIESSFEDSNITVNGGTITSIIETSLQKIYTATFTVTSNDFGLKTINVSGGILKDIYNNLNTESTLSWNYEQNKVINITSTKADGTYGVNESIDILVTFSYPVNVTGTPLLKPNLDRDSSWNEVHKILGGGGGSGDKFGAKVAIDGNFAIIGSTDENTRGNKAGAAYIFEKNYGDSSWNQVHKIHGSDTEDQDRFGNSVAIKNNFAIVGAYRENINSRGSAGAAYIFEKNNSDSSWNQVNKIIASNPTTGAYFGSSVAIDGSFAIIGAEGMDSEGLPTAYIFEKNSNDSSWNQVDKILGSSTHSDSTFGRSVSINGNFAIIGADREDTNGTFAGAAYIFEKNSDDSSWNEVHRIVSSDIEAGDYFGSSVAIDGSFAIIGAYQEDSAANNAGAAYIFEKNSDDSSWNQVHKIVASDIESGDYFGFSVAIYGNYAIVGARNEGTGGSDAGAAYIFKKNSNDSSWNQVNKILASDKHEDDHFGVAVGINNDFTIVGAFGENSDTGAAYIFEQDISVDFSSGSGTKELTFKYIVSSKDSTNEVPLNFTNFSLNGGSIRDKHGVDISFLLPASETTGAFDKNKNIIIDTT